MTIALASIVIIIGVLAWMSGAFNGYSVFALLGEIIRSTDGKMTGLLLVGCIVVIIILALRASGKEKKKEE